MPMADILQSVPGKFLQTENIHAHVNCIDLETRRHFTRNHAPVPMGPRELEDMLHHALP